jgi:hypothetical protein
MTYRRPCIALLLGLVPILSVGLATFSAADDSALPSDAHVAAQVQGVLQIADRPQGLHLDGVGILWMTGTADRWDAASVATILRWVSEGHVCWVDLALARSFGFDDSVGGAMRIAVPAKKAAGHPLLEGVKRVECADTFRYMIEFPQAGIPILARIIHEGSLRPARAAG